MTIPGILSLIAFGLFLLGAAKSFRENGSRASVVIMGVGIAIDIGVSMLPVFGISYMAGNMRNPTTMMIAAMVGGLVVWSFFFAGLFARRRRQMALFHSLIIAVEIGWFVSYVLFLTALAAPAA